MTDLIDRLKQEYGKVWNTDELQEDFVVEAFLAPYVILTRKADGVTGSMRFTHRPRYYFDFKEDPKHG